MIVCYSSLNFNPHFPLRLTNISLYLPSTELDNESLLQSNLSASSASDNCPLFNSFIASSFKGSVFLLSVGSSTISNLENDTLISLLPSFTKLAHIPMGACFLPKLNFL